MFKEILENNDEVRNTIVRISKLKDFEIDNTYLCGQVKYSLIIREDYVCLIVGRYGMWIFKCLDDNGELKKCMSFEDFDKTGQIDFFEQNSTVKLLTNLSIEIPYVDMDMSEDEFLFTLNLNTQYSHCDIPTETIIDAFRDYIYIRGLVNV